MTEKIANIEYGVSNLKIFGTKIHPNYRYKDVSLWVRIVRKDDGAIIAERTTDKNGYFEFNIARSTLLDGVYEIQYIGSGVVLGNDFETFEYSLSQGGYQLILTKEQAIIATDKNGNNPQPSSESTTLSLFKGSESADFTIKSVTASQCEYSIDDKTITINNFTSDYGYVDIEIEEITISPNKFTTTKRFGYNKVKQGLDGQAGTTGPGPVLRGNYNEAETYFNNAYERDVVFYNNKYYFCIASTGQTTGAFKPADWSDPFDTFKAVATGLLLTEDAIITKTLSLGDADNEGIIKSWDWDGIKNGILMRFGGQDPLIEIIGGVIKSVQISNSDIDVVNLSVQNKNIYMAVSETPTDELANGGGIILEGTTDKSIIWDLANGNWTSSENFNIASGKSLKINNTVVISSNFMLKNINYFIATVANGFTFQNNAETTNLLAITNAGNATLYGRLSVNGRALNGSWGICVQGGINMNTGSYIDWEGGNARIQESSSALKFYTWDGNALATRMNISNLGDVTFSRAIKLGTTSLAEAGVLRWNNGLEVYNTDSLWEMLSTATYTLEPTGFANRTDSTLSFNNATRTFTITGTNFKVFIKGALYSKSTESIQIPNTNGIHFIYYNASGTLTTTTSAWSITTQVPIATIYWNGVDHILGEERHGLSMSGATHEWIHSTIGTQYSTGLTGTFNVNNFSISSGTIFDEDIKHIIGTSTNCRILYRNSNVFNFLSNQTKIFGSSTGVLDYDNNGVVTAVGNNFVAYWIFATNDSLYPIHSLMGQRIDNTLANAKSNNNYYGLSLSDLPSKEMKILYRVILKAVGSNVTVEDVQDLRNLSNAPSSSATANSHSSLTGLSGDDHLQYLLLAGRLGGQVIRGSIESGTGLDIYSTSANAGVGANINFKTGNNGDITALSINHLGSLIFSKNLQSNYTAGILGAGILLDYNQTISNQSYLEIDNIVVRNSLRSHIFQKDVVKSVNGTLYVSNSGVISFIDGVNLIVGFDDSTSANFSVGDKIWFKDWNNNGSINSVKFTISSIVTPDVVEGETRYVVTVDSGSLSNLVYGGIVTKINGGAIVLDASSTNNPYINILYDEILKARFGNLSGMYVDAFGNLSGFGFAGENTYLYGNANIAGTIIAGDKDGFGNTFYVGKIGKNLVNQNSEEEWEWTDGVVIYDNTVLNPINKLGAIKHTTGQLNLAYTKNLNVDETYTYSFWIKGDSEFSIDIYFKQTASPFTLYGQKNINVTTNWQRVFITAIVSIDLEPANVHIFTNSNVFYIWGQQAEEGEYATTYQKVDGNTSISEDYGMWAISGGFGGTIQNPIISLQNYGLKILNAGYGGILEDNSIMIGNIANIDNALSSIMITINSSNTTSGIFGYDALGAENFALTLAGTARIAGWNFDGEDIWAGRTNKEEIEYGGDYNGIKLNKDGSIISKRFMIDAITGEPRFGGKITTGEGLQSEDYEQGLAGWKLPGSGVAEFNSVEIRTSTLMEFAEDLNSGDILKIIEEDGTVKASKVKGNKWDPIQDKINLNTGNLYKAIGCTIDTNYYTVFVLDTSGYIYAEIYRLTNNYIEYVKKIQLVTDCSTSSYYPMQVHIRYNGVIRLYYGNNSSFIYYIDLTFDSTNIDFGSFSAQNTGYQYSGSYFPFYVDYRKESDTFKIFYVSNIGQLVSSSGEGAIYTGAASYYSCAMISSTETLFLYDTTIKLYRNNSYINSTTCVLGERIYRVSDNNVIAISSSNNSINIRKITISGNTLTFSSSITVIGTMNNNYTSQISNVNNNYIYFASTTLVHLIDVIGATPSVVSSYEATCDYAFYHSGNYFINNRTFVSKLVFSNNQLSRYRASNIDIGVFTATFVDSLKLDENKYLIAYTKTNGLNLKVVEVNPTTNEIIYYQEKNLVANASVKTLIKITTTKALIIFTNGQYTFVNESTGILTNTTIATPFAGTVTISSTISLDSSTLVYSYNSSGIKLVVGTISNDVISLGTPLTPTNAFEFIEKVTSTSFVGSLISSNYIYSRIYTISGTTITENTRYDTAINYNCTIKGITYIADNFVALNYFYSTGSSLQFYLLSITSTTVITYNSVGTVTNANSSSFASLIKVINNRAIFTARRVYTESSLFIHYSMVTVNINLDIRTGSVLQTIGYKDENSTPYKMHQGNADYCLALCITPEINFQIMKFLDSDKIRIFTQESKIIDYSVDSIIQGDDKILGRDSSNYIYLYRTGGRIKLKFGTKTGGLGETEYIVIDTGVGYYALSFTAAMIDSNNFILYYNKSNASTTGNFCIVNINGTTITVNNATTKTIRSNSSYDLNILVLSSTKAIYFETEYSTTYCYLITYSGTSITTIADSVTAIGGGIRKNIAKLSSTDFVMSSYSSNVMMIVGTISSGSIVFGNSLTIASSEASGGMQNVLSSTSVLATWMNYNTYYLKSVVCSISGTTITANTIYTSTTQILISIDSFAFSSTQIGVLCRKYSANALQSVLLTISGTTVSFGTFTDIKVYRSSQDLVNTYTTSYLFDSTNALILNSAKYLLNLNFSTTVNLDKQFIIRKTISDILRIVNLTNNRRFVFYNDSNCGEYCYVIIHLDGNSNITNTTPAVFDTSTYGAPTIFKNIKVISLNGTKIVYTQKDSTYQNCYSRILSIDENNNVTIGSWQSLFNLNTTNDVTIAEVDTDKFTMFYNNNSNTYGAVCTVSDTTITFNGWSSALDTASGTNMASAKIDTNKVCVVHFSTTAYALLCTVSGTSITVSSNTSLAISSYTISNTIEATDYYSNLGYFYVGYSGYDTSNYYSSRYLKINCTTSTVSSITMNNIYQYFYTSTAHTIRSFYLDSSGSIFACTEIGTTFCVWTSSLNSGSFIANSKSAYMTSINNKYYFAYTDNASLILERASAPNSVVKYIIKSFYKATYTGSRMIQLGLLYTVKLVEGVGNEIVAYVFKNNNSVYQFVTSKVVATNANAVLDSGNLDSTKFFVNFESKDGKCYVRICEFSNDTISFLSNDTSWIDSIGGGSTYIKACAISSTCFVLSYVLSSVGYIKIFTWLSSTLTVGSANQFSSGNPTKIFISKLSSTKFLVHYQYNTVIRIKPIVSVSGTTPTFGNELLVDSVNGNSRAVVKNSTEFYINYGSTGSDHRIAVATFTGNDIVITQIIKPNLTSYNLYDCDLYFNAIDDLLLVGTNGYAARVKWVNGNVLNILPKAFETSMNYSCKISNDEVVVFKQDNLLKIIGIDDRIYASGIVQISGTKGQTKKVALNGDISSIHSNLEAGKYYGIDDNGNLSLLPESFNYIIGDAISKENLQIRTTNLAMYGGMTTTREVITNVTADFVGQTITLTKSKLTFTNGLLTNIN